MCYRRQDILATIFCWPLPSPPSNILEIMEGLINKYVSHWSCKSLNVMITRDQGTMGQTTERLPPPPAQSNPWLLNKLNPWKKSSSDQIFCVKTIKRFRTGFILFMGALYCFMEGVVVSFNGSNPLPCLLHDPI